MSELTTLVTGAALGLTTSLVTQAVTVGFKWLERVRNERLRWDRDKRRVYIDFILQANRVEKGLSRASELLDDNALDEVLTHGTGEPLFSELEFLTEELQLTAPRDISTIGLLLKDDLYCRREILRRDAGLAPRSFMKQAIMDFDQNEFIDRYKHDRDLYIHNVQRDLKLGPGSMDANWWDHATKLVGSRNGKRAIKKGADRGLHI